MTTNKLKPTVSRGVGWLSSLIVAVYTTHQFAIWRRMYAQEIIEHAIDRTSIFVAKRTAEGATLTPLDLERYYGAIMRNNRNAQLENVYIEITTHDYGPHWRRGIAFVLVDACERKSAS